MVAVRLGVRDMIAIVGFGSMYTCFCIMTCLVTDKHHVCTVIDEIHHVNFFLGQVATLPHLGNPMAGEGDSYPDGPPISKHWWS